MPTPLEDLQTRRAAYAAAELKILQSQEYQIGQGLTARRNKRADLEQVRMAIKEIDAQIAVIEGAVAPGARRVYRIVPGC